MRVEERFFEDFVVGEFRQTLGRTITEADIVTHAGQTGDFFPHHMDAEWCATQEFKRRIAHGTLVFSIGVGMTATDINSHAMSTGYDRVRFVKPVFIGDTITVTYKVAERDDAKGEIRSQVTVANQRGEVAAVAIHIMRLV